MPDVTIRIPADKIALILLARPNNERKRDPDYEGDAEGPAMPTVPKYTNAQWIKKLGTRYYKSEAQTGHTKQHLATEPQLDTSDIE